MSRIDDRTRAAVRRLQEEHGPPPSLVELGGGLQKALARSKTDAIETPMPVADVGTQSDDAATPNVEPPSDAAVPAIGHSPDSPITQAMRDIGASDTTVDHVARYWASMALTQVLSGKYVLSDVETGIARFIRAEAKEKRKNADRGEIYNDVVCKAICAGNTGVSVAALSTFWGFENAGIRFETHRDVYRFHVSLMEQIGLDPDADLTEMIKALDRLEELLSEFRFHLPHLTDAQRAALSSPETLLLGIELFAEGLGEVALCKCLRLAVAFRRRNPVLAEAFWLFRLFSTARVDDLLAIAEHPNIRTRALTSLLDRPEQVATRGYDALVAQLTR